MGGLVGWLFVRLVGWLCSSVSIDGGFENFNN